MSCFNYQGSLQTKNGQLWYWAIIACAALLANLDITVPLRIKNLSHNVNFAIARMVKCKTTMFTNSFTWLFLDQKLYTEWVKTVDIVWRSSKLFKKYHCQSVQTKKISHNILWCLNHQNYCYPIEYKHSLIRLFPFSTEPNPWVSFLVIPYGWRTSFHVAGSHLTSCTQHGKELDDMMTWTKDALSTSSLLLCLISWHKEYTLL